MILWYTKQLYSIGMLWFKPPPHCPRISAPYHPVHSISLSFLVSSLDSKDQTLNRGIQCLCTMLFHHCIILWIFRRTWKQPHRLITPVIGRLESWHRCDLRFESDSRFHHNLPAYTVASLEVTGLIKNPTFPWQYESLLLLDGFALKVEDSDETRLIFGQFSGSSILVFWSFWVRFKFSGCNMFTSVKSVPYVI